MSDDSVKTKFVPISRKLTVAVLTTSTIVTTVLTVAQMSLEYKSKSDELEGIANSMDGSLVPALAQMLWDMNESGAKTVMTPVLKSIDASQITLTNDAGAIIYEESRQYFTPNYPFTRAFKIAHKSNDPNRVLGKLEIVFFKDKIIADLRNHFLSVLMLNGLKSTIVASVLLFIFHRLIARPIAEISNYFSQHKDLTKVSGNDFYVTRRAKENDEISIMSEQISLRENKIAEWAKTQQAKVDAAEQARADADEMLKQEKIRAEASARLAQLGEMATSIAHEINNPLAIISGYNHLIMKELRKDKIEPNKLIQTVNAVESTILRITKVIKGLRAYARDGSQDPMEVTPVRTIIDDAIAMTETRVRTKGITLKISVNLNNDDIMFCRPVQIVQTLVALMNNSVDAISSMNERWIELGATRIEDKIRLTVTDAGHGIPPEVETKIFEPFFTTKQVGEGTGLGLSISFGIIKDHGGTIYLDRSCPNTRFVIDLAAAKIDALPPTIA